MEASHWVLWHAPRQRGQIRHAHPRKVAVSRSLHDSLRHDLRLGDLAIAAILDRDTHTRLGGVHDIEQLLLCRVIRLAAQGLAIE